DAGEAFQYKRIDQNIASMRFVQAARHQVEQAVFIQLSDRSTVGAADVFRIDFQFRPRVGASELGKQQAVIALDGIRTISTWRDEDTTAEYAPAPIRQNAAVVFVAHAIGLGVSDQSVVIHMALAVSKIHPVQQDLCALSIESGGNVVTRETGAKRNGMGSKIGFPFLLRFNIGNVESLKRFLLQADMAQMRISRHLCP